MQVSDEGWAGRDLLGPERMSVGGRESKATPRGWRPAPQGLGTSQHAGAYPWRPEIPSLAPLTFDFETVLAHSARGGWKGDAGTAQAAPPASLGTRVAPRGLGSLWADSWPEALRSPFQLQGPPAITTMPPPPIPGPQFTRPPHPPALCPQLRELLTPSQEEEECEETPPRQVASVPGGLCSLPWDALPHDQGCVWAQENLSVVLQV